MWIFLGGDFWNASVFSASRFDSGYMLLPVYVVVGFVTVYSAMVGSTVDTNFASVYGEFVRHSTPYSPQHSQHAPVTSV